MKQVQEQPLTASSRANRSAVSGVRVPWQIPLWQVNLLRVGFLVVGVGNALKKWPLFFDHGPWGLAEGTVQCMIVAMSVLALLGIRYPLRMLPILLFEGAWKLIWLGVIALPLWSDNKLEGATLDKTHDVLWVVLVIAVIPWRYVVRKYVMARGEEWRRRPHSQPADLDANV